MSKTAVTTVPAVVLATMLLSACGGRDTSSAPETVISKQDQTLAESSLLRLSDLPTGWRAAQPEEEKKEEDGSSGPDRCFRSHVTAVTVSGRADSDLLEAEWSSSAASLTAVFSTAADAKKAFAQLTAETMADCFVSYVQDRGLEITNTQARRLSFPALGSESDAHRVVFEFGVSSALAPEGLFKARVKADFVAIREGRVSSYLILFDACSPLELSLTDELGELESELGGLAGELSGLEEQLSELGLADQLRGHADELRGFADETGAMADETDSMARELSEPCSPLSRDLEVGLARNVASRMAARA